MKTPIRQVAASQHRSNSDRNARRQPKTPSSGQHPRRRFLRLAAGAVAFPAVSGTSRAQTYPTRPITMIVPAPAGGPSDAIARVLAEQIRSSLAQPVIIENVSGPMKGSESAAQPARDLMATR